MTARWMGAALAVGLTLAVPVSVPAWAQSLDGPLTTPDTAPATAKAPAAHARAKPRKAHHAAAKTTKHPAAAQDDNVPQQSGAPAARAATPADAVDLGMKWNGNNDGAAQTRFQSGPNTSSGSGAEVGMKLHF